MVPLELHMIITFSIAILAEGAKAKVLFYFITPNDDTYYWGGLFI